MVEGAVGSHRPTLSLKQHGLARRGDSPEESQLFVGQGAAGGIVPELEEPSMNFTDAIGELNPRVPRQASDERRERRTTQCQARCWSMCGSWSIGSPCGLAGRRANSELECSLTWTAARLQTLDHGAPVSVYTVSRKLGHGSEEMVRRVYAHLGTVRHRSEVVEFRIEQHLETLKDRLGNVGFVIRSVTPDETAAINEDPGTPKYRRGKIFQSGPGATRTRDLLLRRGGAPPASDDGC
jgi:hypothetical protein